MDFDGDCITLNHSETSLQSLDFMKKARSAKIEGTCPWLVCTKENFKGHRVDKTLVKSAVIMTSVSISILITLCCHKVAFILSKS